MRSHGGSDECARPSQVSLRHFSQDSDKFRGLWCPAKKILSRSTCRSTWCVYDSLCGEVLNIVLNVACKRVQSAFVLGWPKYSARER
jgi:hypothetical protein